MPYNKTPPLPHSFQFNMHHQAVTRRYTVCYYASFLQDDITVQTTIKRWYISIVSNTDFKSTSFLLPFRSHFETKYRLCICTIITLSTDLDQPVDISICYGCNCCRVLSSWKSRDGVRGVEKGLRRTCRNVCSGKHLVKCIADTKLTSEHVMTLPVT